MTETFADFVVVKGSREDNWTLNLVVTAWSQNALSLYGLPSSGFWCCGNLQMLINISPHHTSSEPRKSQTSSPLKNFWSQTFFVFVSTNPQYMIQYCYITWELFLSLDVYKIIITPTEQVTLMSSFSQNLPLLFSNAEGHPSYISRIYKQQSVNRIQEIVEATKADIQQ